MNHNVSMDGGNSELKLLYNGKYKMQIPNVIAFPPENAYVQDKDLEGFGRDKLDVKVTKHSNEEYKETIHFALGNLTENHIESRVSKFDVEKAKDNQLHNSILASVTYLILYSEKKDGVDIRHQKDLRVNLSTGLPYSEWIDKENRTRLKKELKGIHKIEFVHPWFKQNSFPTSINLIVDRVKVNIEGETTANLLLSKKDNEFIRKNPEELIDNIVMTVDLGAFTTEIIGKQFKAISNGEEDDRYDINSELIVKHRTLQNISKGVPKGIGHAMLSVISDVENEHGASNKFSRFDIEQSLTKQGMRNGKRGYLRGTDINILVNLARHLRDLSNVIAGEIVDLLGRSGQKDKLKRVYLIGGGSKMQLVTNELKKSFKNYGYDDSLVFPVVDPNPVFANAVGYYKELIDTLENDEEESELSK
ncbi:ParM/StbA family protein [Senegalia massiliensis]|uniref:ParM/StbA family protein n=1 Tax=Senegalia massiliensis TaxID=1720316 RepID=A0A845QYP5_9CLOT|nr:ParM/StbA family protein [Senegalia massiliensis]NBI07605.1 ParM/StbA family protein [Senegalia massiliensis]